MVRRLVPAAAAVFVLLGGGCGGGGTPSVTPSSATPSSAPVVRPAPGDHKLTLDHAGKRRTYTVHAPPSYQQGTALPVVIAMHFSPGSAEAIQSMAGLDARADQRGFLVAYPEGLSGSYNALVCCGNEDDVGFVKALVDRLTTTWRADPDRVYATGISNGGDMSFRLAVELPGTFAAIAPVSGGFFGSRASPADFAPKTPVSVITFIGTYDQFASQFTTGIQTWQARQRCTQTSNATTGKVNRTAATCADGSEVVAYTVTDMGHAWPGGQPGGRLADPTAPVNATDLMWEFFAAHPRKR